MATLPRARCTAALLLAALAGCPSPRPAADGGELLADGGVSVPFDAGAPPTAELQPEPGELTILQLDLPVGLVPKMGEAALLVGPTGTLVLIDVGNSNHDDEVKAAVRELNTQWLTPARGFAARSALQVEWVILTHFHGDHVGAFDALTSGTEPLLITRGVVHRGFADVGPAMNGADYQAVCSALRGRLAGRDLPLCAATPPAPCDPGQFSGSYPATSCDGLLRGDLSRSDDDAQGQPSFIDLGDGARLTFLGADGYASTGTLAVPRASFGTTENNEENGRSVSGLVSLGAFRYHFAGDLSGSGESGEPDVETHLVTTAAGFFGPLGVDVVHANHHARKTSSNAAFVQVLAPADGRTRNVMAGINPGYLNSPQQEVLDAWGQGGRLGAGGIFVTDRATGGGSSGELVDARGRVVLRTVQRGDGYWLQAPARSVARASGSLRR